MKKKEKKNNVGNICSFIRSQINVKALYRSAKLLNKHFGGGEEKTFDVDSEMKFLQEFSKVKEKTKRQILGDGMRFAVNHKWQEYYGTQRKGRKKWKKPFLANKIKIRFNMTCRVFLVPTYFIYKTKVGNQIKLDKRKH